MTTTEPLQVLVAESDLSDPALALGLIKKGHTCKAFECNADDPHKIGPRRLAGGFQPDLGRVSVRVHGRQPGVSPRRQGMPGGFHIGWWGCPPVSWDSSRYHSALIFKGRGSGVSSLCREVGVSTPQS